MSRLTRTIRFVRHWHARVGVLAAMFFLALVLTGVALNHMAAFGLGSRMVASSWLMHWYGLHAGVPTQGFAVGSGYFVSDSQRWVMDGQTLPAAAQPVVGAVEAGGLRYIATATALHLYQPDGRLLDKVDDAALPAVPIERIGVAGPRLVVQSRKSLFSTADGLSWQSAEQAPVAWAAAGPLPHDVRQRVEPLFAPALPLERVLLDIHSGRILGRYGPLMMDLAALVLGVLSLSGIWIYWRSWRKKHTRRQHG